MLDELTRTDERTKIEPPKRWRNWWRALDLIWIYCRDCNRRIIVAPGALIDPACEHYTSYPSKEVAEIAASKVNQRWLGVAEHAGATKVDERP